MTDDSHKTEAAPSRRHFLKTAGGAGVGAVSLALLPQWVKPVAEFVVTPASAAEKFFLADIFRRSHIAIEVDSDKETSAVSTTEAPTSTNAPTSTRGPTTTFAGTTPAPTTPAPTTPAPTTAAPTTAAPTTTSVPV